jgi:UDP-GlcNAc:undecaprenyl-phosphate GlcNAc-1-phosphate transferase
LLVPIVALGFPIADTLLAIARRAVRGAPLFSADREHIHHRILALGLSHRQAVLALYGVSVLLGITSIGLGYATREHALLIIAVLAITVAGVLWRLGYLQVRRAARLIQQRRRNLELRASVREIGERLRRAAAYADVLEVVNSAAPALDAQLVALRSPHQTASARYAGSLVESAAGFSMKLSLQGASADKTLEVVWSDGRTSIDRDTEIAVERLCQYIDGTLKRIEIDHARASASMKVGA